MLMHEQYFTSPLYLCFKGYSVIGMTIEGATIAMHAFQHAFDGCIVEEEKERMAQVLSALSLFVALTKEG